MSIFLLHTLDKLALDRNGTTIASPSELLGKINQIRDQFYDRMYSHSTVNEALINMIDILTPYQNTEEPIIISADKQREYKKAYRVLINIYKEEKQYKRLLRMLDKHEQKVGSLNTYQKKLKKIIQLAASKEEFALSLESNGLLDRIESYNSGRNSEDDTLRWLSIKNKENLTTEEAVYYQNLEIAKYWLFYLVFKFEEYKSIQSLDQIVADSNEKLKLRERQHVRKIEELKNEIKTAEKRTKSLDEEMKRLKSITDIVDRSSLLPSYAQNFEKDVKQYENDSKSGCGT